MILTFGSLFAGIGGFDIALENAGMECRFQAEIDPQCRRVLSRNFQGTEIIEDVQDVTGGTVSVVTAGWPCQGNSVAGRRAGMADERSGLWSEVVRVLAACRPQWFLGENVPGILSVNGGRDWLAVLRDLAELGYGTAYRVLDAQWFGVAQRRRRVFVVGCLGDWRRAAQVLFESDRLPWNSPTREEARQRIAACLTRGTDSRGRGGYAGRRREDDVNIVNCLDRHMGAGGPDDNAAQASHLIPEIAWALQERDYKGADSDTKQGHLIAHTLRAEGHDASEDGTGRGTPIVPIDMRQASRGDKMTNNRRDGSSGGAPGTGIGNPGDPCPSLADSHTPAVAYQCHGSNVGPMGAVRSGNGNETGGVPFISFTNRGFDAGEVAETVRAKSNGATPMAATAMAVRRLTPLECLRLQGFPDDWLDIDGLSDSAKYRMCGNAVAVPCVEWIGRRIVESAD